MKYDPELVKPMREEVTRLGVEELKTVEDVEEFLDHEGIQMIFVNSVCGCAGSSSRPAIGQVIEEDGAPDRIGTVFAGQDVDATEYVRELASGYPPSSPSFYLFRDGEPVDYVPREVSKHNDAPEVARILMEKLESLEFKTAAG